MILRNGILGGNLGTPPVSVFILASHFADRALGPMDQVQAYLIFITLGALVLGDAISRSQKLTEALKDRNRTLQASLHQLSRLNNDGDLLCVDVMFPVPGHAIPVLWCADGVRMVWRNG